MPITKTAQRALRSSKKKEVVNRKIITSLEVAIRQAKKTKLAKDIVKAISLADRAAKKKIIHKNKAARIKSSLSKLSVKKSIPKRKSKSKKPSTK